MIPTKQRWNNGHLEVLIDGTWKHYTTLEHPWFVPDYKDGGSKGYATMQNLLKRNVPLIPCDAKDESGPTDTQKILDSFEPTMEPMFSLDLSLEKQVSLRQFHIEIEACQDIQELKKVCGDLVELLYYRTSVYEGLMKSVF